MPDINYKALDSYIADLDNSAGEKRIASLILIYGEELLYKAALETVLDTLLPQSDRHLNYDPMDGTSENIPIAVERVNTFSLLSGTKVVALLNSNVFHSKQNESLLLAKAEEAYGNKALKKAAGYFLSILALLNLALEDIDKENRQKLLKLEKDEGLDDAWIDAVIDYAVDNQLSIPTSQDTPQVLGAAIEKGFPKNNYLIITTELVDKRQRLFKTIRENGMIIDCSVAKGERRVDKTAQEEVLVDRMKEVLKSSGKTMGRDAFSALSEMTGFDLRTFSNNLEKLVNYVGENREIRAEDVESALERTKRDPIYELTNAITDRNIERSLFFLSTLLSETVHPLQALAAMINSLRKLLIVKSFIESPSGQSWNAGCQYNQFRSKVMPAIQAHDKQLTDQLEEWEKMISEPVVSEESKKPRKRKKKKIKTDLLIAANPNNPYPVFQTFKKSERFTTQDLIRTLGYLADADKRLKSTGQNPKLVIEETMIKICLPHP